MYEKLNLNEWVPTKEDITLISDWLLTNTLSSPKNYLARILLTKLNWDFNEHVSASLLLLLCIKPIFFCIPI